MLLNRLTWLSKKHRWFSDNQHGFLDGRSTETAAHSLISFVEKGFRTKQCSAAAFIDIKSAFDSAWPPAIIQALAKRHCPVYLAKIIQSFLEGRKAIFNFQTAHIHDVEIGCPQGSVLSPFLWAVLVDDAIRDDPAETKLIVAYADDITLISKNINPAEAVKVLQSMCDRITNWLEVRKLGISASKSALVIFSRRPTVITAAATLNLHLGGAALGPNPFPRISTGHQTQLVATHLIALPYG